MSAAPLVVPGRRTSTFGLSPWVVAVGTGVVAVVAASAFQLARGPAPVGLGDLWAWLTSGVDPAAAAVIEGARLPRWESGLLAGCALGAAGVLFQGSPLWL